VPQGSCLGPLLFLFFVNDLPKATEFFTLLFADDTTFQLTGSNIDDLIKRTNSELLKAEQWFAANKLTLNIKKTKYILFKNKFEHVHYDSVHIGDTPITRVGDNCEEKHVRFLGILIDEHMSFEAHIHKLKSKLNSGIYALSTCQKYVPVKVRKMIYLSLIESHLRFGSIIYGAARPGLLEQVSVIQRRAVRQVANAKYNAHTDPLFKNFKFLKLSDIIHLEQTLFMQKYGSNSVPSSFRNFFSDISLQDLKCRDDYYNFQPKVPIFKELSFFPNVQLIQNWNRNNILLKSEGKLLNLKVAFIANKLNSYEEECLKNNCYICNR
jgi:hypothetical protein